MGQKEPWMSMEIGCCYLRGQDPRTFSRGPTGLFLPWWLPNNSIKAGLNFSTGSSTLTWIVFHRKVMFTAQLFTFRPLLDQKIFKLFRISCWDEIKNWTSFNNSRPWQVCGKKLWDSFAFLQHQKSNSLFVITKQFVFWRISGFQTKREKLWSCFLNWGRCFKVERASAVGRLYWVFGWKKSFKSCRRVEEARVKFLNDPALIELERALKHFSNFPPATYSPTSLF